MYHKYFLALTSDYKYWPDLYTYTKNEVTGVYEVETEDTINDEEAKKQWKPFSSGTAAFYLIVPEGSKAKAEVLIKKWDIKVKDIYTFE